jgi:hypothetical protein
LLLPPLLAFVLARLVLSAAALSAGIPPSKPGSWCRFDCAHYVGIALHGYQVAPCPAESHDAGRWCGNAAWLPGYPLLVRAVRSTGTPPRRAAVLVSGAFALLALVLAWVALAGAPGERPDSRASAALVLAALFPGIIFAHAISPLGLFEAAVLLALLLAARDRPLGAGLAGAAAAFTYPPGALLAPVLGAGFLLGPGTPLARARRAALSSALAASGVLGVMTVQYLDTGRWWAFALVQSGYNYSLASPLRSLGDRMSPLFRPPFEGAGEAPAAQTLLVVLLVCAAGAAALLAARQGRFGARERFVALYVVAAWLLPLVIGEVEGGLHRREAALVPLALLTARLPAALQAALAGAAGLVAYALALQFFRGQLV